MANEQPGATVEKNQSGIAAFVSETQREIGKVTWPTRKEITVTTMMIVIFALVTGTFFLMVDSALGYVVTRLLGMN